ncbi:hypothetical protein [Coleofasciculus chthonoplastes]
MACARFNDVRLIQWRAPDSMACARFNGVRPIQSQGRQQATENPAVVS